MTTTPSIGTMPSARRMASTAAPSAVFLSPRPIQRALARAPASVTRTSSRARLRLISAETLSARSGRAIRAPGAVSMDLSPWTCGCYACGVPAWHPRTYFSWATAGGEGIGNHEPAAGDRPNVDSMGIDPRHSGRDADLPDLSPDGRLLPPHRHRPLSSQVRQRRCRLRLQPQQRPRCRGHAAGAPQPFPFPRLRGRRRRLHLQAQMGGDADAAVDQHLSDSPRGRRPARPGSSEATSLPSLVGRDLSRRHSVANGQHRDLQERRGHPGNRRRRADRAGLYRWSLRGLPPLPPDTTTPCCEYQIWGCALPGAGRRLRRLHRPRRASCPDARRAEGSAPRRAGANRISLCRRLELLVLMPPPNTLAFPHRGSLICPPPSAGEGNKLGNSHRALLRASTSARSTRGNG